MGIIFPYSTQPQSHERPRGRSARSPQMNLLLNVVVTCIVSILVTSCAKSKSNGFQVAAEAVGRHDLAALRVAVATDPALVTQGSGFDGGTLLHDALVNRPSFECAEFLLAHGADPNQPDVTGEYPIHVICRFNGDIKCLKLLLANGADPSSKWKGRMTPAQLARSWHFEDAASILEAATTKP